MKTRRQCQTYTRIIDWPFFPLSTGVFAFSPTACAWSTESAVIYSSSWKKCLPSGDRVSRRLSSSSRLKLSLSLRGRDLRCFPLQSSTLDLCVSGNRERLPDVIDRSRVRLFLDEKRWALTGMIWSFSFLGHCISPESIDHGREQSSRRYSNQLQSNGDDLQRQPKEMVALRIEWAGEDSVTLLSGQSHLSDRRSTSSRPRSRSQSFDQQRHQIQSSHGDFPSMARPIECLRTEFPFETRCTRIRSNNDEDSR